MNKKTNKLNHTHHWNDSLTTPCYNTFAWFRSWSWAKSWLQTISSLSHIYLLRVSILQGRHRTEARERFYVTDGVIAHDFRGETYVSSSFISKRLFCYSCALSQCWDCVYEAFNRTTAYRSLPKAYSSEGGHQVHDYNGHLDLGHINAEWRENHHKYDSKKSLLYWP